MSDTALLEVDKPVEGTRSHRNRINVAEAIKLRLNHNYSYQQIADHYGVSKQAVHLAIRKFAMVLDNPTSIKDFDRVRAALLTNAEAVLISQLLDSDKIKDASLNNVAYAFTQINNARRLELGQSTNNIDIRSITMDISDIIKQCQDKLADDDKQTIDIASDNATEDS
jgi:predicted DNA-binding protein YlxM (UPF0122 family)